METYVAARYYPGYEFEISTLFWGALILVALVVACLFARKAIQWLLNRRKFDGAADEGEHPEDPKDPWAQAISRPLADHHYGDEGGLGGLGGHEPARAGAALLDLCPPQGAQRNEAPPEGA